MLRRYAQALIPWAESTAATMLEAVNQHTLRGWKETSAEIGRGLRQEIEQTPVGDLLRKLQAEQVKLITSIPEEAAARVHRLTMAGITDSGRAAEVAREILRTGEVAESRAMLIARTEVSRATANLNQARAEQIGSTEYIWRTSGDGTVRSDHKALNGKVFRWDSPPIADDRSGTRANPGCIWNCRCWAEPIIPE